MTVGHSQEIDPATAIVAIVLYGWDARVTAGDFGNAFFEIGDRCNLSIAASDIQFIGSKKILHPRPSKVICYLNQPNRGALLALSLYTSKRDFHGRGYSRLAMHVTSDPDKDTWLGQVISIGVEQKSLETCGSTALDFIDLLSCVAKPYCGFYTMVPADTRVSLFASGYWSVEDDQMSFLQRCAIQTTNVEVLRNRLPYVYEANILTSGHMQNKIGGRLFPDWVCEIGHGKIEELKSGLWIWRVPPETISIVRSDLAQAGMLIFDG